MRFFPVGIELEGLGWSGHIPGITTAVLEGDFLNRIVDGFVAVTEDGAVRANLIKSGPERPTTRGTNEATIAVNAPERDVIELGFLKPGSSGMNSVDRGQVGFGQLHQETQNLRAFSRSFGRHFVIARGCGFESERVVLLAPNRQS